MSFQVKIDRLLEAKKLDKTAISKKIGVSRNTVYNLTEKTAIGTYLKICSILNITLNDLVDTKPINDKSLIEKELLEAYRTISKLQAELLQYTDLKKDIIKPKKQKA